jgi:hypothetical protein
VQALHLMNSTKLMGRIADGGGRAVELARGPWSSRGIVQQLYLTAYCRYPSDEEMRIAVAAFGAEGATRETATQDVMWALVNSAEFVLNH